MGIKLNFINKYLIFFLLSLTLFVAHALYTKHAIYGDGNGYYVTAQSLLYDHTLKSDTILTHLKNFPGRDYTFSRVFWDENNNPYSIGTSLFWLPALVIASVVSNNPLDLFHEISVGVTGIIFMLTGLYFIEKYLSNIFDEHVTTLTIYTLFFGSNILYYTGLEPALSHQPAFFLVAFLMYWSQEFIYSPKRIFVLGLLMGLLPVTRLVDLVLLIPIFFSLKWNWRRLIVLGLGFILSLLPQLFLQYYYFGTIFKNSYLTESVTQWTLSIPHLISYLFSFSHGLFIWSPIFLLGFYGLLKSRRYLMVLAIVLLWIIGSSWSAYDSAGFGQRLSFSAIPYLALGVAYFYHQLTKPARWTSAIIFSLFNLFLLYGFFILNWKNIS
ncbi:MAG: hypothetical protein WCG44_03855 [bacterium]